MRCPQCVIEVFGRGELAELGGAFVSLNVRTLDGVALADVPVIYLDGLHDTWDFIARRPYVDPFTA